MASAKLEAEEALYKAITQLVGQVNTANATAGTKASIVQRLAVAYRAVEGGPQPGPASESDK